MTKPVDLVLPPPWAEARHLAVLETGGQHRVDGRAEECQHADGGQPGKAFDEGTHDRQQDAGEEQCEKRSHADISLSDGQVVVVGSGDGCHAEVSRRSTWWTSARDPAATPRARTTRRELRATKAASTPRRSGKG